MYRNTLSTILASLVTSRKGKLCLIPSKFVLAVSIALVFVVVCTFQLHYVGNKWRLESHWENCKDNCQIRKLSSRDSRLFRTISDSDKCKNVVKELQEYLQHSFKAVQNPLTCNNAKFFICDLGNGGVGFGARVHEITFCHFLSYSLNRILILKNAYLDGLDQYTIVIDRKRKAKRCPFRQFKEINVQNRHLYSHNSTFDNSHPLLSYRHYWKPKTGLFPPYLPGSVPWKIVKVLERNKIQPDLWFIGQSVHFLIGRLKPRFKTYLTSQKKNFNLTSPYVGLHIRHGDKVIKESQFIPAVDYMKFAKLYFDKYHPDINIRNIYVATDDPLTVIKLRETYAKGYNFISSSDIVGEAKLTSHSGTYNVSAMKGLLSDIFFLVQSNYVVCTLSSNIGRLVYELRQAMIWSNNNQLPYYKKLVSMDEDWYYNAPGFYHKGSRRQYAVSLVNQQFQIKKNQNYSRLIKNKWYRLKASHVARKGKRYKFSDLSLGFVLAHNVFVYPLKTEITDRLLEKYVDKHLLNCVSQSNRSKP